MLDIHKLTIRSLSSLFKKRELTVKEVVTSILENIRNNNLNTYINVFEESALKMAEELDKNINERLHLLYGVPIAIKDNINIKGTETTCASNILRGYHSPYDATVIKRIKEAGAVIIGKTNMDEFAMGSSGEHSAFGPTHNPLERGYVPGGSSSGSAASVAGGEALCAIGSDTGGSVRQPASFCGVVGLKPTYGRVSRYGLVAFASSLDQIGPIAKNTVDTAVLFSTIAGYDPMDSTSIDLESPTVEDIFSGYNKERMRIGIPKEYFTEGIDREIEEKVLEGLKALEQEGFVLKEVSLPHTRYAVPAYHIIATSEASSNLARYDGTRYGFKKSAKDIREMYSLTRTNGFGLEVKRRILLGAFSLSSGYYEEYYLKAQKVRTLIRMDFDEVFKEVDIVVSPTSPVLPFRTGERIKDPLSLYLIDIYTVTANLAGIPAISVPCGRSKDGLPIGIQFMARAFEERSLFKVARFLEELLS